MNKYIYKKIGEFYGKKKQQKNTQKKKKKIKVR